MASATFYTFSKRHNSTKQPTGGSSYTITLKDACSVSNPTISLKWPGTGSPTAYNMCYIPSFGRYYWIDNWTFADRQWTASCSVDVLASFKTDIGSASKYVLRAASDKNIHVLDNTYPALTPPTVTKYPINLQDWVSPGYAAYSSGSFVVGIVGQGNSFASGGIVYVQMTPAQFETMITNCFVVSMTEWSYMQSTSNFGDALKEFGQNLLKSVNNPFDYINSVRWFPFSFITGGAGTVQLGRINTQAVCNTLTYPVLATNDHITFAADASEFDWEKIEPYCTYRAVIPPFGSFMLDSRQVGLGGGVDIYVWNDAVSGLSNLQITAKGFTETLIMASAQVGVPIEIGGIQADMISSIGAGASIAQAAAAAATGGVSVGLAAAALHGVASAVGDGWFDVKSSGSAGGVSAVTADRAVYVTKYDHAPQDPTELGYPLCDIKTISSLSGYVQCADGELDTAARPEEYARLQSFLTGGFFYE